MQIMSTGARESSLVAYKMSPSICLCVAAILQGDFMRRLTGYIAVLFAIFAGTSAANADGGSLKDGPAPVAAARTCDGGPFAGFYVGGAVGYASQDTKNTDVLGGTGSVSYDDNGVAASLYSGYNIQCDRLVVGYESDWNWMDSSNAFSDSCCFEVKSDIKWFSTARLRVGLVHSGNILFYATGGIAYADIDTTLTTTTPAFQQSDSDLKFGWTAGAGVEFIRHGQWSVRAEALYLDLGDETYSYSAPGCIACEGRQKWEDDLWIARIGLTYRLGAREEVVAAPLK